MNSLIWDIPKRNSGVLFCNRGSTLEVRDLIFGYKCPNPPIEGFRPWDWWTCIMVLYLRLFLINNSPHAPNLDKCNILLSSQIKSPNLALILFMKMLIHPNPWARMKLIYYNKIFGASIIFQKGIGDVIWDVQKSKGPLNFRRREYKHTEEIKVN